MKQLIPDNLTFSEVGHLPIVKQFARQIHLVDTINTMVKSQMQLPPGEAVLAMVLDTLFGRTPLYRLKEFFHEKESARAIQAAVNAEDWIALGSLAETVVPTKRPAAVYRAYETTVRLYDDNQVPEHTGFEGRSTPVGTTIKHGSA